MARAFGSAWCLRRRSLILLVPSVVARVDRNVLINPQHPDFPRAAHGLHQPVWWDERLLG
ncbi:RES family NAD+ phosphorylase [Dongia sp.]|uniref:RES family NAD+ phosphorylase n=1 Tax=Dongia sp. TaxID=1977262 RepID=UPI00375251C9